MFHYRTFSKGNKKHSIDGRSLTWDDHHRDNDSNDVKEQEQKTFTIHPPESGTSDEPSLANQQQMLGYCTFINFMWYGLYNA